MWFCDVKCKERFCLKTLAGGRGDARTCGLRAKPKPQGEAQQQSHPTDEGAHR